jgi:hypothetical protein
MSSTDSILEQYDKNIYSLVDDFMDWSIKYRTDEEILKREAIIHARYGEHYKTDSEFFYKKHLVLSRSSMVSNIVMSYLFTKKIIVPHIDFLGYCTRCWYSAALMKYETGARPAPLPEEQVKMQVNIVEAHARLFLYESNFFTYMYKDGTPKPKLTEMWGMGVTHVRRAFLMSVSLLHNEQVAGHEFVVMWEIRRVSDTDNFEIVLFVIDNLISSRYTQNDRNLDVHKILIDTVMDEIRKHTFTSLPLYSARVITNELPAECYRKPGSAFEVDYSCMSIARRGLVYCAMLRDVTRLSVRDSLESFVPMEQILNPAKRKRLSPTETRYAYNLMMYVKSVNSINNFILSHPLIWTQRDLMSLDAQAVAMEKPFPIYILSFKHYNGLPLHEYLQKFNVKTDNYTKFYLNLHIDSTPINLMNADTHDLKELYYDMENPAIFTEAKYVFDFDKEPKGYCSVSSRGDLLTVLQDMHSRLLGLEQNTRERLRNNF